MFFTFFHNHSLATFSHFWSKNGFWVLCAKSRRRFVLLGRWAPQPRRARLQPMALRLRQLRQLRTGLKKALVHVFSYVFSIARSARTRARTRTRTVLVHVQVHVHDIRPKQYQPEPELEPKPEPEPEQFWFTFRFTFTFTLLYPKYRTRTRTRTGTRTWTVLVHVQVHVHVLIPKLCNPNPN